MKTEVSVSAVCFVFINWKLCTRINHKVLAGGPFADVDRASDLHRTNRTLRINYLFIKGTKPCRYNSLNRNHIAKNMNWHGHT